MQTEMNENVPQKKEQQRTKVKKAAYLAALRDSLGIKSTAMRRAGIASRATILSWEEKDRKFAKAVEEISEMQLDFGESKLMQLIQGGDTTATIFFLKTKGKKRGYTERMEVTGNDGKDLFTKSDEELDGIISDLRRKLEAE